jgi:hypothetical protein
VSEPPKEDDSSTANAAAVTSAADEPPVLIRVERQALGMAAAVFAVTLVCWGGATFACNKHPPQYKSPSAVEKQDLARTPKDAAIELRQRELSGDLAGALELAEGAAAEDVKRVQAECGGNCGGRGAALTRAEVVRYEGPQVLVRTLSQQGSEHTRLLLKMERRGPVWKAVERTAE